ncbi:hypothetical protein QQF64_022048 [Cirrhinus molitorella]|uniref:Uncharacterized protein n=1 Tax=Cirrhinus molitorella TaxID=172907 RepID=A0ABR3L8N8_9TELE
MLTRCDDSYETEFSQLPEHLGCVYSIYRFATKCVLYSNVFNLWDTDQPDTLLKWLGTTVTLQHCSKAT